MGILGYLFLCVWSQYAVLQIDKLQIERGFE